MQLTKLRRSAWILRHIKGFPSSRKQLQSRGQYFLISAEWSFSLYYSICVLGQGVWVTAGMHLTDNVCTHREKYFKCCRVWKAIMLWQNANRTALHALSVHNENTLEQCMKWDIVQTACEVRCTMSYCKSHNFYQLSKSNYVSWSLHWRGGGENRAH